MSLEPQMNFCNNRYKSSLTQQNLVRLTSLCFWCVVICCAYPAWCTDRDIHHDTLIPGLLFAPEKLFSGTDEAFSFTNDADRRICKKRIGDLAFKEVGVSPTYVHAVHTAKICNPNRFDSSCSPSCHQCVFAR